MKFNDLLNKYITEIGCTAKELSEVSGLSAAALSRYRTACDADRRAGLTGGKECAK